MHKFLIEVQKRPGLYFGSPEQPYTKLLAFMDGYSMGYKMGQGNDQSWPKDFVPSGFEDFVCQRLGAQDSSKTWRTHIQEHTSSEKEAFSLFFRLVKEYEKKS